MCVRGSDPNPEHSDRPRPLRRLKQTDHYSAAELRLLLTQLVQQQPRLLLQVLSAAADWEQRDARGLTEEGREHEEALVEQCEESLWHARMQSSRTRNSNIFVSQAVTENQDEMGCNPWESAGSIGSMWQSSSTQESDDSDEPKDTSEGPGSSAEAQGGVGAGGTAETASTQEAAVDGDDGVSIDDDSDGAAIDTSTISIELQPIDADRGDALQPIGADRAGAPQPIGAADSPPTQDIRTSSPAVNTTISGRVRKWEDQASGKSAVERGPTQALRFDADLVEGHVAEHTTRISDRISEKRESVEEARRLVEAMEDGVAKEEALRELAAEESQLEEMAMRASMARELSAAEAEELVAEVEELGQRLDELRESSVSYCSDHEEDAEDMGRRPSLAESLSLDLGAAGSWHAKHITASGYISWDLKTDELVGTQRPPPRGLTPAWDNLVQCMCPSWGKESTSNASGADEVLVMRHGKYATFCRVIGTLAVFCLAALVLLVTWQVASEQASHAV